jgi:hypothetical protein
MTYIRRKEEGRRKKEEGRKLFYDSQAESIPDNLILNPQSGKG